MELINEIGVTCSGYTIEQAGQVLGQEVEIEIPYQAESLPSYSPKDQFSFSLFGRRYNVFVESVEYKADRRGFVARIKTYTKERELTLKSYSKELRFLALTHREYKEFQNEWGKYKNLLFVPLIRLTDDEFGRYAWSSGDIINYLGALAGFSQVLNNCFPYWVRQIRVPQGVPFIEVILDLVALFNPLIFEDANTLYIIDRNVHPLSGSVEIKSGSQVKESYNYDVAPSSIKVEGYEGEFIPDRYPMKTYENQFRYETIELYGLTFKIPSYGELIEETISNMTFQGWENDIPTWQQNYELRKYSRDIFGEKGPLVYLYKERKVIQEKDGTTFEIDKIVEQEVHYWHFTEYKWETPRQDSLLPVSTDFTANYQPVIVKVQSKWCYYDNGICETPKHWTPLAKVTFVYKFWNDTLGLDVGLPGQLICEIEDSFGVLFIQDTQYNEETKQYHYKFKPLAYTTEEDYPVGEINDFLPLVPNLTDIKELFNSIWNLTPTAFIEHMEKVYRPIDGAEGYWLEMVKKQIDKETGEWRTVQCETQYVNEPLRRVSIRRRKQNIEIEEDIGLRGVNSPPRRISAEVIDWVDAERVLQYCRKQHKQGKIRREYEFPIVFPIDVGWHVQLSSVQAPDGTVIPDRSEFNGFITAFCIERDKTGGRTFITVEGE